MPRVPQRRIVFRPAAAYTTSFTSQWFTTPYHDGIILNLYATALAASPSVVISIEGWDTNGSGAAVELLAAAAVTDANPTHKQLKLYPGAITSANAALDRPLPSKWRVKATAADADSLTYKFFADLIPA